MTPIPDANGAERGVVAEGAVGSRLAGHFRMFRYEVRRWHDGVIPDIDEAVTVQRTSAVTQEMPAASLMLVPEVPTLVWGRDELRAGDMWNSNSVVSWLLARAGLNIDALRPPTGGRAPGWKAGLVAAKRAPLQCKPLAVGRSQVLEVLRWVSGACERDVGAGRKLHAFRATDSARRRIGGASDPTDCHLLQLSWARTARIR